MLPIIKRVFHLIDKLEQKQDCYYFGDPTISRTRKILSRLTNRILVNAKRINKKHFADIRSVFERIVRSKMCELDYFKVSNSSLPFSKEILLYAIENNNSGNMASQVFVHFVELCSRETNFSEEIVSFLNNNGSYSHYTSYRNHFISASNFSLKNLDVPTDFKKGMIRIIETRFFHVSKKAMIMSIFLGIGEEVLQFIKNKLTEEIKRSAKINENIDMHKGEIVLACNSMQDLVLAIYLINKDERYNIPFINSMNSNEEKEISDFKFVLDMVSKI